MTDITVNSDSVDKVTGLLEKLAEQFGVATDHFYPIFVQQQIIDGYYSLMWAVLALIFANVSFASVWGLRKDGDGASVFFFALGVFSIVVLFLNGSSAATHLLNPEYHALMAIGDFAKDVK